MTRLTHLWPHPGPSQRRDRNSYYCAQPRQRHRRHAGPVHHGKSRT